MSKPEWGLKRICQACGCKYYDMRPEDSNQKGAINCPSCGVAFDQEALLKSRRIRTAPAAKPVKVAKPVVEPEEEAEDAEDEIEAEEDDEIKAVVADVDVADDVLDDDDDDDLAEVVIAKDDDETT